MAIPQKFACLIIIWWFRYHYRGRPYPWSYGS